MREVTLAVDGRLDRSSQFNIPINSASVTAATVTQAIAVLRPGEKRAVSDPALNWMADPDEAVEEISEGNNLWAPRRK